VVEGEAKREAKEVERRRLQEQVDSYRNAAVVAEAETVRVVVEANAKNNANGVEKRRPEEQSQAKEIAPDAEA
jgi:hypothetical protein